MFFFNDYDNNRMDELTVEEKAINRRLSFKKRKSANLDKIYRK